MSWELNADVGEGFPYDEKLLTIIDAANVACGFHAGDDATMLRVCQVAARHGVAVGAQPSYRDRDGFGRRDMEVPPDRLVDDLVEQVQALTRAARAAGTTVRYLKPHGALYNRTVWDEQQATAVVTAAARFDLPVMGLPGSRLLELATKQGLAVRREFFADRAYTPDGRLVARGAPGAVITDPDAVLNRVRHLVEHGEVVAEDGRRLLVEADSICVHGDSPGALGLARAVRQVLDDTEAG